MANIKLTVLEVYRIVMKDAQKFEEMAARNKKVIGVENGRDAQRLAEVQEEVSTQLFKVAALLERTPEVNPE